MFSMLAYRVFAIASAALRAALSFGFMAFVRGFAAMVLLVQKGRK